MSQSIEMSNDGSTATAITLKNIVTYTLQIISKLRLKELCEIATLREAAVAVICSVLRSTDSLQVRTSYLYNFNLLWKRTNMCTYIHTYYRSRIKCLLFVPKTQTRDGTVQNTPHHTKKQKSTENLPRFSFLVWCGVNFYHAKRAYWHEKQTFYSATVI